MKGWRWTIGKPGGNYAYVDFQETLGVVFELNGTSRATAAVNTKQFFNGMGIENSAGNSSCQVNAAVVAEMVLNTSGMSAEINSFGPVMNVIPKEGFCVERPAIQTINTTYGVNWRQSQTILDPRLVQFSGSLTFSFVAGE